MAVNNSRNVSFGKPKSAGALFVAPAGTTVPTNATSALDAAFKNLGYISDEGLVNNIEANVEDVFAWGGQNVLSDQSTFMEMFTYNLIETNIDALKHYYGDANVTITGSNVTVRVNDALLNECVFVAELVMTGGRVKRIVVERGRVVNRSAEITYVDGEPVSYPIQLRAFPSVTDGDTHKEYITNVSSV